MSHERGIIRQERGQKQNGKICIVQYKWLQLQICRAFSTCEYLTDKYIMVLLRT